MSLTVEEREAIEDAIFDAHFAAQKYIEGGKDIHEKLLEVTVEDAFNLLSIMKSAIQKDDMKHNYRLHLMVPLQLLHLIQSRKAETTEGK